MPTNRQRRTRAPEPTVSENVRHFLETGASEPGDIEVFMLRRSEDRVREVWEKVKDEILANWIKHSPCTRPWSWWASEAPREPVPGWPKYLCPQRRRIGGIGEPQHERIAVAPRFDRGVPVSWFDAVSARMFDGAVAIDLAAPPRYESEASFLRHRHFLTASERKHLREHPELLEPEAVTFDEDESPTTPEE